VSHYTPPNHDMSFVLFDVLNAQKLADIQRYSEATEEMQRAILEEAGKMAEQVLLPINESGDREGCTYDPETHSVKTPKGFPEAYKTYQQGGWTGLSAEPEFGGQGLPHLLKIVVDEMCCSSNLSFGMYPGLSHGAIDLLSQHGTDEQKAYYLPKMVEGVWTGTMCLTEPQCGTDLGLIRTKAEPSANGSYEITGTKIWITGGEHDLADNIVHLVLAKLPDAPQGSKGISLFVVPKFLEDGSRNEAFCGGLEHKMGIKASATCVMNFDKAQGWLVGKPNEGLKCMFTMMNAARIMVGVQGLGLAETAYQVSLAFAKDRRQSRSLTGPKDPSESADAIIVHPDVRRMLLKQKVFTEGARALAYWVGLHLDLSHAHSDSAQRERSDDLFQLLTPVVKSYLTDEGYFSSDSGLQAMGGAGFTQDWPVEQLLRDGRIARIYEGTNGIQALDLVGRKLTMKGGQLVRTYFSELKQMLALINNQNHKDLCEEFIAELQTAVSWLGANAPNDPEQAGAVATPLLKMFALTSLAVLWAKMAQQSEQKDTESQYPSEFLSGKRKAAEHFYRQSLPELRALAEDVKAGKGTLMAMSSEEF
jgi:alkylation response protein AidB-like acyl-CoA dehydrogenase